MVDFVRVRSVDGPDAEYMAPKSLVDANPDRYVLVDPARKRPKTSSRVPGRSNPNTRKPGEMKEQDHG